MSTGSRTVMSPRLPENPADAITRQASARGLGGRPGLRFLAVVLWSGFLGAVVVLFAWLALTPPEMLGPQSLGELTGVFLAGWGISLVPAVSAALLAQPLPRRTVLTPDPRHGR